MNEFNIFRKIDQELQEFKTQSVHIVDKLKFNQKKTIEQIYRYYNSTYETGDIDSEGDKKYFFNIVRNPCYVAQKAVSFDTKDIIINPVPGQSSLKAWLLDRDLKFWMKKKNFDAILNRMFYELPIFGTVVFKKVQGNLHFVDLRNLICEQSADDLRTSSYVIEMHYYTPEELRKFKERSWKNIEETIKMWRETKVPYIRIIERYGEVPENWIRKDGDPTKYVYSRFIVYSREYRPREMKYEIAPGYILDAEEIDREKDFPYREIHWEKIPGRWLGIGRVEILFDPQIRINEMTNLKAKASRFTALNIFQTADETVTKNPLTKLSSGQILFTRSPISRIPTEERSFGAFEIEHRNWLMNRDELTMAYDVIRGERLPAGTPLGAAIIAREMATSYFDQIKRKIVAKIKELLYQDIIPQFLEENKKEHYLRLVGEDLDKWQEIQRIIRTNQELFRFLARRKHLPTAFQFEIIRARIAQQKPKEVNLLIEPDFYEDLKYDIDIEIGETRVDLRTKMAIAQMALQAITVDRTLLEDPVKRKLFAQILATGGMSIEDVEPEGAEIKEVSPQPRVGGGVGRPIILPTPEQVETSKRI